MYSRRVCRGKPKTTPCRRSLMLLTFGRNRSHGAVEAEDGSKKRSRALRTGRCRGWRSETPRETCEQTGEREAPRLLLHRAHLIEGQLLEVPVISNAAASITPNPVAATHSRSGTTIKNTISIRNPAKNASSDHLIRRARCVYSEVRLTASTSRGLLGQTLLDLVEDALLVGRQWHGLPASLAVEHDYRNDLREWKGAFEGGRPKRGAAISVRGRVPAGPQARPSPVRIADRSDSRRVRHRPIVRCAGARAAPPPPAPGPSRPRRGA